MSNNCSRCRVFSKDLICSIMMKLICEISCSELLKWTANSQVNSFVLQHVRLVVTKSYFKFSRGGAYILQVAFGTSGQINDILR